MGKHQDQKQKEQGENVGKSFIAIFTGRNEQGRVRRLNRFRISYFEYFSGVKVISVALHFLVLIPKSLGQGDSSH